MALPTFDGGGGGWGGECGVSGFWCTYVIHTYLHKLPRVIIQCFLE